MDQPQPIGMDTLNAPRNADFPAQAPLRRSFDSAARRRSAEHALSQRRYDEHWGAAEGADCRVKCQRDGVILHVHSQLLGLASHVFRDMLALLPQQVEGMTGPSYALTLDDDSAALAAALDMVYPTAHAAAPTWAELEGAVIVADKYGMEGVRERCVSALLEPRRAWRLDSSAPGSMLRWLAISQRLQLSQLNEHLLLQLQRQLPVLARDAALREDLLTFASESLDKTTLLHLLRAALEGAALAIPARGTPPHSPLVRAGADARAGAGAGDGDAHALQMQMPIDMVHVGPGGGYDLTLALQALMSEQANSGRAEGAGSGASGGSSSCRRPSGEGRHAQQRAGAAAAAAGWRDGFAGADDIVPLVPEGVATSGEEGSGSESGGPPPGARRSGAGAAAAAGALCRCGHRQDQCQCARLASWLGSSLYGSGVAAGLGPGQSPLQTCARGGGSGGGARSGPPQAPPHAPAAGDALFGEAIDIDTALATCGFGAAPLPQRKRHRAVAPPPPRPTAAAQQVMQQRADLEGVYLQLHGGSVGGGGAPAPGGCRWHS